jgi:hypothetical protein
MSSDGVLHQSLISNVLFRRWDGEGWSGLGASDQGRGVSDVLSQSYELHLDQMNRQQRPISQNASCVPVGLFQDGVGNPMVFWIEATGLEMAAKRRGTFARRWTGSGWEPIWAGSDEMPGLRLIGWQIWQGAVDVDNEGRFAMAQWQGDDEGARIAVRVGRIPHWEGLPTTAEAGGE